jgi:hypothetical protein
MVSANGRRQCVLPLGNAARRLRQKRGGAQRVRHVVARPALCCCGVSAARASTSNGRSNPRAAPERREGVAPALTHRVGTDDSRTKGDHQRPSGIGAARRVRQASGMELRVCSWMSAVTPTQPTPLPSACLRTSNSRTRDEPASSTRRPQAWALLQRRAEEAAMKRLEAGSTRRSGTKGHNVAWGAFPEAEVLVRLEVGGIVFFYRERRPSIETRTASYRQDVSRIGAGAMRPIPDERRVHV